MTGTREFLVQSTEKVIGHYRHLLANQRMSETERRIIQDRIEREERTLRLWLGANDNQESKAQPAAAIVA
jgi:hypothetical protein